MKAARRWLFAPVPLERIALLRLAVYAFVIVDVLFLHTSGYYHGWADPVWYQPLHMGTIFHLPAATVLLVELLKWGSVVGAVVAMTGRYPRAAGWFEGGNRRVNSFHHQAVAHTGSRLSATVRTPSGVIEAIERTDGLGWAAGVQWHNELMWRFDERFLRPHNELVAAACE